MTLRVHPDAIVAARPEGVLAIHHSWERVRLGQVADVLNGFAFASSSFGATGDMPIMRIRDVGKAGTETWYSGPYEAAYIIEPGALIVGMDGEFRVDTWRGPRALLNQRVCKLTVRDPAVYSERFLRWALPGYLDAVNEETSSVTVKHLSSETVKELPVPLPPLAEQERIVAAIEEQFSRLDAGVAALERAQRNLKRMRAAMLRDLLAGADSDRVEVESITTAIQYGYTAKASAATVGPKMLRITDIQDGTVNWGTVPHCLISQDGANKFRLAPGDLVFARTGATVGKSFLIREVPDAAVFASYLIRLRFGSGVLSEYIGLFFQSQDYWQQVRTGSQGIGQPNVNARTLGRIKLGLPSVHEQEGIVRAIDDIDVSIARTSAMLHDQWRRSRFMRSAILTAAFSGKLAPQDAKDEPATNLLQRIAAEQASSNGHKSSRNGTRRTKVTA